MPGRFKRGIGVAMSMHHNGQIGYTDQEESFEKTVGSSTQGFNAAYGAEVELTADGFVTMKNALPDSGTNHDTALATLVSEILGFTTRDRVRAVWGDSDLAPSSNSWFAGRTITQQGGPLCSAADKLRRDLLQRAAADLKVDAVKLEIRDGVISSTEDPKKTTTFAALAKANGGFIRQRGKGGSSRQGIGRMKAVGACFVEVEVDTLTGDWKFLRSVYSHDVGLVVNPLVSEAEYLGRSSNAVSSSVQ